jgi:prepilin-type processing-associated H-X9-DG protein
VTKYTRPGRLPELENEPANYSPVLQCPQAMTVRPHYVSYAMNMIVAVDPLIELSIGKPPRAQTRPARLSDMRNETALVWDTAVFVESDYDIDFPLGLDIDGERFMKGAATPQFRYYSKRDPFAALPGHYGQNAPIRLDSGKVAYRNIDPASHRMNSKESAAPYRGNLRFRHSEGTGCNAGFADGSVGRFVAVPRPDKTIESHNALRRNFMILWPGGVPADPAYPQ